MLKYITIIKEIARRLKSYCGWSKQSRKRLRIEPATVDVSASKKKSKYEGEVNKTAELNEICEKILDKHASHYTKEQVWAWAILIQMGKHDDYENPPDKHFFKTGKSNPSGLGISPGKRLNMRSECINQLDKWHSLMGKGAITSEQYKDIQDNIMNDIKKM